MLSLNAGLSVCKTQVLPVSYNSSSLLAMSASFEKVILNVFDT